MIKETTEEIAAWERFMEAHLVHKGHDTKGIGSPITRTILEDQANNYDWLYWGIVARIEKEDSGI